MRKMYQICSAVLMLAMLLGTKNGHLALWKEEDPLPCRIFPVRTDTLPPADQLLLRRGIRVESAEALQQLLEDYS